MVHIAENLIELKINSCLELIITSNMRYIGKTNYP